MNYRSFARRALIAVLMGVPNILWAQPYATKAPAPLGLLRLNSAKRSGDAAPLAEAKFGVDELSSGGIVGATRSRRDNVDYLALDAGKEWARPLRGSPSDVTFVSFQVYASQTTIVDIAGVRLGLTTSPIAGRLELMYDDSTTGGLQWHGLGLHLGVDRFGGKALALLPTLTVRVDAAAGVWDLFSGSRLLADNLPLIEAKKNDRRISIRAGSEGAWITGLVLSDENPIYEDANANAIDDRFEMSHRGALLPANATKVERQLLARQWRDSQRTKLPAAFFVQRLLPDNVTASAPKS